MRLPVLPTLIVGLAVAAMIALGLWQLEVRLPEKEAELAQLARNPALPVVAFPAGADQALLFRRATLDCRPPVAIRRVGAGQAGFRLIATCGDGAQVQLGTTRSPSGTSAWPGGPVTGRIGQAPDARPLIARLFDHRPAPLLLIAAAPPAGLGPNTVPTVEGIPNNHLSYAVQWFAFAGVATAVFLLAARRRG